MPVAMGRLYVTNAPPFTPLPYGLMSVAIPMEEPDQHWRAGVEFQPDPCESALATQDNCPTDPGTDAKTATSTGLPTRAAEPFTVYSWIDCAVPSFYPQAEARTSAALTNGEARAVENAFWTGGPGGEINPHLAADTAIVEPHGIELQTAADVITGGVMDIVEGMGYLEGALAECYGGEGVIHVPRRVLAHLAAWNLVQRDGQRLRTLGGTLVAAGAGYPGTGPAGELSPAQAWLYATGAVGVWRGPIVQTTDRPGSVRRDVNSVRFIAERTYVVGWDCCHFAQLVSTGGVAAGAPGVGGGS